ncbi:MAG: putative metal-dependent hydrolase [Gemmataceae bacterium]|nr:putative metal-dependent hydrolase [Gemmataceae bacterium]MCI0740247.1 putative metal-dependent hydrolase [Gemmataceae bacterium]
MTPPEFPVGPYVPSDDLDERRRQELIDVLNNAPAALGAAVTPLNESQLDMHYKNWTIRQIVHHLADSHLHSYIRFKWTLTEEQPTIKAHDEGRWAALADSRAGDIGPALRLFEGLHVRWVQLLSTLSPEHFARAFHHPETGETNTLGRALGYDAWHCRHHTGQILWLTRNTLLEGAK